jgi:uncharacterized protein YceK
MKLLLVVLAIVIMNGCAPIQEQYKPLYQVKPEIKKLEVK